MEGGQSDRAVVATFRMSKPSADPRGTNITARLSFQIRSDIGLREEFQEIGRVNYAVWLGEESNSAHFLLSDTKEVILAIATNGKVAAVQDNRHSISRLNEPSYFEIEPATFFVVVTLVDEIYGPLITYCYKIETDPLKISEIIQVRPRRY